MSVLGAHSSHVRRTPSQLAQYTFSLVNKLQFLAHHRSNPVRFVARVARRLAIPLASSLGAGHLVNAELYGHHLLLPAEHPLAPTLAIFPAYNSPLAFAAQAVVDSDARASNLVVIDVGANVGDTVALIEQISSNASHYLCIEADREIAEICRINHSNNPRVQVKQCFIGDQEGVPVSLEDDGRANPSGKLLGEHETSSDQDFDRIIRLDEVATPFVESHGRLSLIKIDTEGYDFSVLRSGSRLLGQYHPALFYEWYPKLLTASGEGVWDGFEYLASLGYQHYVLFTNQGEYYCSITNPDKSSIETLACLTLHHKSIGYFDVFASTDRTVCQAVEELAQREMESH